MTIIKYLGDLYQYTSDLQLLTDIAPVNLEGSVIEHFNLLISSFTRRIVSYDRAMDVVEHLKLIGIVEEI